MDAVDLGLQTSTTDTWMVLSVAGEIDIATTEHLDGRLQAAVTASRGRLILDLSDVEFLDADGLWSILRADAGARLLSGQVRLAAPSRCVARLMAVTGLDRRLCVYPDVTQASLAPLTEEPMTVSDRWLLPIGVHDPDWGRC